MAVVNTFGARKRGSYLGNFFDFIVASCLGLIMALFFGLYLALPS